MSQRIRLRVTVLYKDQTRFFLVSARTYWTIQQLAKHILEIYKKQSQVHKGVRDHLTVSSITTEGYYMSKFQKVKNLLLNEQRITCQIQVVKKAYVNQQQAYEVKIEHCNLVNQKKQQERANNYSMEQQVVQVISSQSDLQEQNEEEQNEAKKGTNKNQAYDYIKDKQRQLEYYNQDKVYLSLDKIQKNNLKKQKKKQKKNRKKQKKKLEGDNQIQQQDSSSQEVNKFKNIELVNEKKVVDDHINEKKSITESINEKKQIIDIIADKKVMQTQKKLILPLPVISQNLDKRINTTNLVEIERKLSTPMQIQDPSQKAGPAKIPERSQSKDSLNLKISLSEQSIKKLERDFERDKKNKQIIAEKSSTVKPYSKTCSPKIIFHKEEIKYSPMSGPISIEPIRKPSGDFNLNKTSKINNVEQINGPLSKKSIQIIKQSIIQKQTNLKQSGLKNSKDSSNSKQMNKEKAKANENQKNVQQMSVQIVAQSSSDQQQILKNVSPKITIQSQVGPKNSDKLGNIQQLMNRYNIIDSNDDDNSQNDQQSQ